MAVEDTTATDSTTEEETEQTEETEQESEETEGEQALGDPGKKALDKMKAARNAAIQEANAVKAELQALKDAAAAKDLPAEQQALDAARREGEATATTAANTRILRTELKAAAKGKLADPLDALAFIDLTDLAVDANGDVDSDALEEAIDDLLTRKPHLAAAAPRRFDGGADQGAKGKPAKPSQLTESQYSALSREERAKARADGRVNTLLGAN